MMFYKLQNSVSQYSLCALCKNFAPFVVKCKNNKKTL